MNIKQMQQLAPDCSLHLADIDYETFSYYMKQLGFNQMNSNVITPYEAFIINSIGYLLANNISSSSLGNIEASVTLNKVYTDTKEEYNILEMQIANLLSLEVVLLFTGAVYDIPEKFTLSSNGNKTLQVNNFKLVLNAIVEIIQHSNIGSGKPIQLPDSLYVNKPISSSNVAYNQQKMIFGEVPDYRKKSRIKSAKLTPLEIHWMMQAENEGNFNRFSSIRLYNLIKSTYNLESPACFYLRFYRNTSLNDIDTAYKKHHHLYATKRATASENLNLSTKAINRLADEYYFDALVREGVLQKHVDKYYEKHKDNYLEVTENSKLFKQRVKEYSTNGI